MRSNNWLRNRREELGIRSQDDLAALLQLEGFSVTRAAISHWENETRMPPITNVEFRKALSKVLRLTQPELLRLAGYDIPEIYSDAAERAANIIESLSPDQQKLALRLLEQFLAS